MGSFKPVLILQFKFATENLSRNKIDCKLKQEFVSALSVAKSYSCVGHVYIFGKNHVTAMQARKIGTLDANRFTNLLPNQSFQTQRSPVSRHKTLERKCTMFCPIFKGQFCSELISKKKINVLLHFINLHNVTTKWAQKNKRNPLPTETVSFQVIKKA